MQEGMVLVDECADKSIDQAERQAGRVGWTKSLGALVLAHHHG
jgi:hypothetical protein